MCLVAILLDHSFLLSQQSKYKNKMILLPGPQCCWVMPVSGEIYCAVKNIKTMEWGEQS